jgi:hypothetical protein
MAASAADVGHLDDPAWRPVDRGNTAHVLHAVAVSAAIRAFTGPVGPRCRSRTWRLDDFHLVSTIRIDSATAQGVQSDEQSSE